MELAAEIIRELMNEGFNIDLVLADSLYADILHQNICIMWVPQSIEAPAQRLSIKDVIVQLQAKGGTPPLQATGFAMLDRHKLPSREVLLTQFKR